ncbi:MAG: hypothetical protein M1831_003315 [Alyxoria varia]|nr:MAG: hypothetical protein M1831_003315 [Alyxoria varia]
MADPFESLFNLEDRYYNIGYRRGRSDGLRQSQLEARVFGIEKGFQKFVEMGELLAKARILEARLLKPSTRAMASKDEEISSQHNAARPDEQEHGLLPLPDTPQLRKHIHTLLGMVDPAAYSTENTPDAVSDIDDRIKKAHAKLKIIERLTGEDCTDEPQKKRASAPSKQTDNMEDFGRI